MPARRRRLWDVRKAGLNIMMSMRGDGKPVSFIEDCAVPLEHLADYVARLTRGVCASTARAARGTRTRRSARCTCGRSSTCAATARQKMRAIAEEASAMVREYKGAFSGEHGDGLVRSEWVAWQFGPRLTRAFEEIKALFDPDGPDESRQDRASRPRWTTRRCSAIRRAIACSRCKPRSTGRRGTCRTIPSTETLTAPGTGGDPGARLRQGRRDVQQQRPLPQVRRGHDVPELSRDARRGAPDARPREHAAARAVRPARARTSRSEAVRDALDLCVSCKGCRRECPTGVDMAKMKIEFLHH